MVKWEFGFFLAVDGSVIGRRLKGSERAAFVCQNGGWTWR